MAFVRADEFQFGFLLLFSTSVFQSASVAGRTQQLFQPCGKPRTLAVIVGRHLDIEHTLEMKQIKLTTLTFGLLLFGCNEDY